MKKKILVLGGAGYIAGYLVDLLNDSEEFEPYVYDNLLYEDRYLKPVSFFYGDIRDCNKICDLYNKYQFNSIVILAALVGDSACAVNPSLTEKVNYEAVKNICRVIPDDVHMVFMSTASVYGTNESVVTEKSETKPLSCYASTKLKAEKPMLARGATVFRLGTVYGVGDTYSRIRADLVVNTLTIKAFVEGEITLNGGEQYRPIISARDVAEYIFEACKRRKEVSGLYNLCYKNVKIVDLADEILKVFPNIKVNKIDQMFQDERNYKVNTELADSVFEYRPHFTVQEEIERLYFLLKEGRIKDPLNINYNNGLFLSQNRL